jgi:hypothetical protein
MVLANCAIESIETRSRSEIVLEDASVLRGDSGLRYR